MTGRAEPVGPDAPACARLRRVTTAGLLTPGRARRPLSRTSLERLPPRARSSPSRPVRGAGPPRPRPRRRPRARRPRDRPRRRRLAQLARPAPWQTIGGTFVTLLKALVPPLIVHRGDRRSIANLAQVSNAARLAGQTLLWFAITALIAVAIGIGLGLLTQPGRTARSTPPPRPTPERPARWLDFLTGLVPGNILGLQASARRGDGATAVVQRAPAHRHRRRGRRRRAQGRRAGRAVPRLRPLRAGDRAEGAVVGHPPRPDRHPRPDRQRGRQLRLGVPRLARRLRRRGLRRPRAGAVRRLPGAAPGPRLIAAALLRRCLAGHPAGLRLPLLDRHAAGDRARHRAEPGRPAGLRLLRRAAGRDDEDGRLRRDLPGAGGDLRGAVLRRRPRHHRLPADRAGLRRRLGGHRRGHRRGRHADAHAVDAGPARWPASACCWPSTRSSTWAAPR